MIDFPASPTDGQVFSATNGVVYKYSTAQSAWLAQAGPPVIGGTGEVVVSLASWLIPAAGSDVQVPFATVLNGNAGLWFNTTTFRYTPPAGKYYLSFTGYFLAPSSGNGSASVALRKNGARVPEAYIAGSASANFWIPITYGAYVDANGSDYFDWVVNNTTGTGWVNGFFSAFPLTGIKGPTGGAPGAVVGDFFAANNTPFTMATVETVVVPPTIVTGNSGGYYNNSTGRYTPPAGRYLIFGTAVVGYSGGAVLAEMRLRKNGAMVERSVETPANSAYYNTTKVAAIVDANGTDYFELSLWGNSVGNACSNLYFGATPTQGMVGPQGPTGLPGQIGWRQISAQTVSGQPFIDVTALPVDINHLQVFFSCTPGTNDSSFGVQLYNGAGVLDAANGNYLYGNFEVNNSLTAGSTGGATSSTSSAYSSGILFDFTQTNNRVANNAAFAGSSISGDFRIANIRDTAKQKVVNFQATYPNAAANLLLNMFGGGHRTIAGAMTGFRLLFLAGSTISGSVTVWGSP